LNAGGAAVVVNVTQDILNVTMFRQFWISWDNGFIRVGIGTVVGVGVFVQYLDSTAISVNYMAVSGWTSSGTVIVNYGSYFNHCVDFV